MNMYSLFTFHEKNISLFTVLEMGKRIIIVIIIVLVLIYSYIIVIIYILFSVTPLCPPIMFLSCHVSQYAWLCLVSVVRSCPASLNKNKVPAIPPVYYSFRRENQSTELTDAVTLTLTFQYTYFSLGDKNRRQE